MRIPKNNYRKPIDVPGKFLEQISKEFMNDPLRLSLQQTREKFWEKSMGDHWRKYWRKPK